MNEAEKKEIIQLAEVSGVSTAAKKYQMSKTTIYSWIKVYKKNGELGLEDGRQTNPGNQNQIPDWKRKKVLAIKEIDPGFGPSQIRGQLRREGITISIKTSTENFKAIT